MSFNFSIFESKLDEDFIQWLIESRYPENCRRYSRLWDYYQNTAVAWDQTAMPASKLNDLSRRYIQAQEAGLPSRITGINGSFSNSATPAKSQRKEIVIENDIAWRINAMVDYLFGKDITIKCRCEDERKNELLEKIINRVFSSCGGSEFFQNLAVIGSVYGFVDCIVRCDRIFDLGKSINDFNDVLEAVSLIDLDIIEAANALPVLEESNYKKLSFYIQHFTQQCNCLKTNRSFVNKLLGVNESTQQSVEVTEIISADFHQLYHDNILVRQSENRLGIIPVAHIQNIAQPCFYEGLSDVEPLIPLQDELNTRLSDRANRITLQSFKMYLAKGIEPGSEREILPGRMWCTDNDDAEITEFGGDAAAGGEDLHIQEIREALDKVSGVTPVVAGVIRSKLGNLTSAVALKMTLMGTLAKTERKRLTYGEGIKQICRIVFAAIDKAGILKTQPQEGEVDIRFPNPLPEEPIEKLAEAKAKLEIGVPREKIIQELGY